MYTRPLHRMFLIALLTLGMFAQAGEAHALKMTMKRIVFDQKKRSESLVLINDTNTERTYRITWVEKRMIPDKSIRTIRDGDDMTGLKPLGNMVRVAPRRITIPAQAYQTIRLMARVPSGTEPGEYRSHLNIMPEPKAVNPDKGTDGGEGSFSLQMITGVSLPIFLRVGDGEGTAEIVDAAAVRNEKGIDVSFSIERGGNQSTFGDLDMVCIKGGGEEIVLKQVRGIAVYTEIDRRELQFQTVMPEGQTGACSSVSVRYVERDDNRTRERLLAETRVPIT